MSTYHMFIYSCVHSYVYADICGGGCGSVDDCHSGLSRNVKHACGLCLMLTMYVSIRLARTTWSTGSAWPYASLEPLPPPGPIGPSCRVTARQSHADVLCCAELRACAAWFVWSAWPIFPIRVTVAIASNTHECKCIHISYFCTNIIYVWLE